MADGAVAVAGAGGVVGGDAVAQALLLLQGAQDSHGDALRDLLNQRRAASARCAELSKQLKLAKKKQDRVFEKAKTLSNEKLMGIITARAAKAKAKGKAKAKAKIR